MKSLYNAVQIQVIDIVAPLPETVLLVYMYGRKRIAPKQSLMAVYGYFLLDFNATCKFFFHLLFCLPRMTTVTSLGSSAAGTASLPAWTPQPSAAACLTTVC